MSGYEPLKDISTPEEGSSTDPKVPSGSNAGPNLGGEEDEFFIAPETHDTKGVEGRSKSPIRTEPTRKPSKVQNVVVNRNTQNPSREMIVKWDRPSPELKGNFYYKVYVEGDTKSKIEILDSSKQEVCFKELKSGTKYVAFVSITKDGKESEASTSTPIFTDRAHRTPGFKINEKGKPKIIQCSTTLVNGGDGLASFFEWSLPDLGIEKNNYTVVGTQALYKEDQGQFYALEKENDTRAKPVVLKFGTVYEFAVKQTYMNLDTYDIIDATSKQILKTDIGKPEITNVKCQAQKITVSCKHAEGANKHALKIKDEAGATIIQIDSVGAGDITFDMTNSCNYGKMCTMVIEASNMTVDKKSESNPFKQLIGGDQAVTGVTATQCDRCPRRGIIVRWKQPKRKPEGYLVQLFEHVEKDMFEENEIIVFEQTQLLHRFVELKTSTQYFCVVRPRYKGEAAKDGSQSNVVTTQKRIDHTFEAEEGFGSPEEVNHKNNGSDSKGLIVMLSWKRDWLGENYKLVQQHLVVSYKKYMIKYSVFDKNLLPKTTTADIEELESGLKYYIKLTSVLMDLDSGKESKKTKESYFHKDPSKVRVNDCKYKNGIITFSWESIKGANKYMLEMKDDLMEKEIAPHEIIVDDKCEVQVQASERLCIGRTCTTRVTAYVNERSSQSDWKAHLIGGILVPRNVKADRNSKNPKRSILVTFDHPKKGPVKEYKIVAKPESGKPKSLISNTNTVLFEYLRKGIRYRFDVYAKHDGKWSDGSPSNYQETESGDWNMNPTFNFSGIKGTINMQHAEVHGSTATVNIPKGEGYGKVRDLTPTLNLPDRYGKEILILTWIIPSFDNNAFDYKVERYNVEIREKDSKKFAWEFSIEVKKKSVKYSTKPLELELGELYEVSVSTTYTAIDEDEEYTSSAGKIIVQTRPCAPTNVKQKICETEKGEEALKIEWNAANGAESYEIAIYTDKKDAFKKVNTGKETEWIQTFDDSFGYGTSYHAVITSIGRQNKKNSATTAPVTIGGDYSPKKMHADIKHDKVVDPNTQVYLTWEPPTKLPESYQVSYEESGKYVEINCRETECLVEGLKAGEYYTFEVIAIHSSKQSGGCISNRIQTNPTPMKVKNLHTSLSNNPCTSIIIHWNKIEAEKKDESTIYRVAVTAVDNGSIRQINNITKESICVSGLESGTEYFTTVAGGNSIGFGEDSEKCFFETDLGMPKNVRLLNNTTSPSTSLILKFSNAEGEPIKYICIYKSEQTSEIIDDVQSGHAISDLEPNTDYYALVYAVFQNEKNGGAVKSEVILTAPSKPEMYESRCCVDDGISSSRELMLRWKSDIGCAEHEVQIKHGEEVENRLTIKNKNYLKYLCQYEASRYTARVRSKNHLFGPWSDEKLIDLAPMKLTNATAELKKDGSNIIVKCKKMTSDCLSYFCQAFCNNLCTGEPMVVQPKGAEDNVIFNFVPAEHAETYSFKLWVGDAKGLKGDSVFTGVVISRPAPGKLVNLERITENSNTDIAISWDVVERCDEYEVKIKKSGEHKYESCIRTTETKCGYRCQYPGSKYSVRVRGICSSVHGKWSEKKFIELVPAEVEFNENSHDEEPVETIQLNWRELEPKPSGYQIILYQGEEKVKEERTKDNQYTFAGVPKSGLVYYCTVAGYNDAGIGKPVKTKHYRIKWSILNSLLIKHDETDPSRRATISWDRPDGVNCFKLKIANQQGRICSLKLDKTSYIFKTGIPGNSYTVTLYAGCNGYYSTDFVQTMMTMRPTPPTNIKARVNIETNEIRVSFNGISSQQQSHEICVKCVTKRKEMEIRKTTMGQVAVFEDLVPGGCYEVSVTALCQNQRSSEISLDNLIYTYPDKIKQLRLKKMGRILAYEWDPPAIKPDKGYVVQWRVNNEPITEEPTQGTKFEIRFLKPAHSYKLRVMAKNRAGSGEPSDWKTFDNMDETTQNSTTFTPKSPIYQNKIGWRNIDGVDIQYCNTKSMRQGSNVFEAERRDATGTAEKIVVKFIPNYNEKNKREVEYLKELVGRSNVVTYYQSGLCQFRGQEAKLI